MKVSANVIFFYKYFLGARGENCILSAELVRFQVLKWKYALRRTDNICVPSELSVLAIIPAIDTMCNQKLT